MSNYAVNHAETRQIAQKFLAVSPFLTPVWGNRHPDIESFAWDGVAGYETFRDSESPQWALKITDPMGRNHVVEHDVVLKGLHQCVYEHAESERTVISMWVMQTAEERKKSPLPGWGASRIVQAGLFATAPVRFPYKPHSPDHEGPAAD
ncbi:hypothetical protein ABT389_36755 [Streptomyces bacillaris]|uniref:hypothetical protein n=1 Tax=Streptomyces bacillaris TaxID=68179 RepID=UPI00334B5E80